MLLPLALSVKMLSENNFSMELSHLSNKNCVLPLMAVKVGSGHIR
jgi:hypothetical protein